MPRRRRASSISSAAPPSCPSPTASSYYAQVCGSKLAFIRWRAGDLPFERQVSDFLHVPAAPASDDELDALRAKMRSMLGRMGYSGDLAAQCAGLGGAATAPADEVQGVLAELLDEAWERTAERMEIPAPKSDGMRVTTVTGAPFNARCNYMERQVELNVDPVLTRPSLKHLAVHECYPGHYVQFKLRETWYRRGEAPADGLLSVVNTASSCTFEGIADNGLRVLDWLDSDDDQLSAILTRYRAGIGTAAAWRLHALGQPAEQVTDWLRANALIGGEGWVANRMRFIAAPQRCALIWSYWWGEAVGRASLGAGCAGAAPSVSALPLRPHALAAERGTVRLSGAAQKGGATYASCHSLELRA